MCTKSVMKNSPSYVFTNNTLSSNGEKLHIIRKKLKGSLFGRKNVHLSNRVNGFILSDLIFELLPIYLFTSLTFIDNWLTDHNTSLPLICGCTALRKNVCSQQQACHSIFIPSSSLTVLVFIVPFTSNIHVIAAEFLLLLYSLKGSAWQAKGFSGNKQY